MTGLTWRGEGGEFHAQTRYGEATIAKYQGRYYWRIEHAPSGVFMRSEDRDTSPPDVGTFDEAEKFILLSLAFLTEPPTVDPNNPRRWLPDSEAGDRGLKFSLDLGERALPPNTDPTQFARLRVVRMVLFGDAAERPGAQTAPAPPTEAEPLKWEQVGNEFQAATRFGRAVITEHREQPNPWALGRRLYWYTTRIEHPSGAVLRCCVGRELDRFAEFEEAEEYIKSQLDGLAHPPQVDTDDLGRLLADAEVGYPLLAFTLDVCANSLPPDTDPVHVERFELLKSELFLAVD